MGYSAAYTWSDPADRKGKAEAAVPPNVAAVKETLLRRQEMVGAPAWVGYLDVLGFAREVERAPAELFSKYKDVRRRLIQRAQTFAIQKERAEAPVSEEIIRSAMDRINALVFFSDSLFIFGTDETQAAHEQVCDFARMAFRAFFEEGLPTKGAIERGPVWADFERSIFLGAGINRAHRLCESLDHIGVVAQPMADALYLSPPLPVPSKVGSPVSLCVPRYLWRSGIGEREIDWRPKWQAMVDRVRASVDVRALGKYEASADIVRTLLENGIPVTPTKKPDGKAQANDRAK